jgi:hypothetical protein
VRPPQRQGHKLPEVTLNVVLAVEPNPSDGATPIQWLLLTTLPIDTAWYTNTMVPIGRGRHTTPSGSLILALSHGMVLLGAYAQPTTGLDEL